MDIPDEIYVAENLSHIMDCLGYSQEMIYLRSDIYVNFDAEKNEVNPDPTVPYRRRSVGSRGEGTVKYVESDWDALLIDERTICVEPQFRCENLPAFMSVFTMIQCVIHPGHYKLLLKKKGEGDYSTDIDNYLTLSENRHWLSSKKYLNSAIPEENSASGPAVSAQTAEGTDNDIVYTFPAICASVLSQWAHRPRKFDWPAAELIKHISQRSGNMVANGIKGCRESDLEWRLCFNESELLLVQSWNDTQMKLYKVLKMIKKNVLKQDQKQITSYILKNIVFWLSEAHPQSHFESRNLFVWVKKALLLLKRAVKLYYLPYYMIPNRNLLAERISRSYRRLLINQISDIICSGPKMLTACHKMQFAMKMSPEELLQYKEMCDELEELTLLQLITDPNDPGNADLGYVVDVQRQELLTSPWPHAVQVKLDACLTIEDRFKILLS